MNNNSIFNSNTYRSVVDLRGTLTGDQVKKDFEMQILAKVLNYKLLDPTFTFERICKDLNLSVSAVNRMRRDCNMFPFSQYLVSAKQGHRSLVSAAKTVKGKKNKYPTTSAAANQEQKVVSLKCDVCQESFKTSSALKLHDTRKDKFS